MKKLRIAIAGAVIIGRRHMELLQENPACLRLLQIRDVGYPDAVWRGEPG